MFPVPVAILVFFANTTRGHIPWAAPPSNFQYHKSHSNPIGPARRTVGSASRPLVATKTAQPSRLRLATEKQDPNFATEKIKNTRLEKFIITEMAEKYFGPKLRVEGRVVSRWPMGQSSEDWVKNLRGKIFSGNAPGGTS